jgi:hypothetical protein
MARNAEAERVQTDPGCCPNCEKPVPDLLAQRKKSHALIITCPFCGCLLISFPPKANAEK